MARGKSRVETGLARSGGMDFLGSRRCWKGGDFNNLRKDRSCGDGALPRCARREKAL